MRWFLCILVAALGLPLSARSGVLGEMPFQYREGLLWLKVAVSGRSEPLNFLFDSGASVSALDLRTAQRLGLKLGPRQAALGVNGPCAAYRLDHLQAAAGGIALPTSAVAIDLRAFAERCHQPVEGILGADVFRGRIVQIDFAAGRVRVLNRDAGVQTANGETLPVKRCNGAFCVPVRVAGQPAQWMRLDTGCDAALEWVAKGQAGQSPSAPAGGPIRYRNAPVQLGTQRFCVTAGVHPAPLFAGEAGLLGNGLLPSFA